LLLFLSPAFFITILVLAVMFGLAVSIFILTLGEQKIAKNIIKSSQAYYIAEAGIEDALWRLKKDPEQSSFSYTLSVGGGSATTTISDIIGGARVIVAEGDVQERIRKISVAYQVSTQEASFYYGAQIGDGGIIMRAGSEVRGNLFSNGNAVGSGNITDTVIVARNGNKIEGLTIGRDAYVHTCKDSIITGILTYVSGGSVENCTAGEIIDGGPNEIQPRDFPITQSMIDNWKSEAESGGIINGDLTIDDDTSLGPVKINGNLLIRNAVLTITGTIWITGTFDTGNNVVVELDEDSYGDLSGVLMADGNIQIRNNADLRGTEDSPSSYLLVISNNPSLLENDAAIDVKNNALGSILFAPNGLMVIHNNVELIEATAYQLLLENNAQVIYEIGLENLEFTSGPGGSWEVTSWKEVE
jgi:hypothetical protein